jgi:hypothetical protein
MTSAWRTLAGDSGPANGRQSGWLRPRFFAGQHPARGRLRVGQEAFIDDQVLVRQRRQRLAQLQHGPQDQSIDLAAVEAVSVAALSA